jgi:glycosyltransferase involved in cell wall biosynthesis
MIILDSLFRIPSKEYLLNTSNDISILIKTFKRPDNLKRLLSSLQQLKCTLPIFIADDSPESYETEIKKLFPQLNLHYNVLPFDTGLSEGRNILLRQVTTPYFLLCDDDFIFDKRSRVLWMKEQLKKNDLDILGGVFFEYRPKTLWDRRWYIQKHRLLKRNIIVPATTIYNYYGSYQINGKICTISRPIYKPPITRCDFCHNYFIGRTQSVLNTGGWKKELKVGEHEHFFIKAKMHGLKVATTQEAGIFHGNFYDTLNDYLDFRTREPQFKVNVLGEFGIEEVANYKEILGFTFEAKEENER